MAARCCEGAGHRPRDHGKRPVEGTARTSPSRVSANPFSCNKGVTETGPACPAGRITRPVSRRGHAGRPAPVARRPCLLFGVPALLPFVASLLALAPPEPADTLLLQAVRYVTEAARQHQREEGTPGLALVLVTRDTVVASIAFGVTELGGAGRPVTDTTRFQAGSLSKAFTAAALLQLQEEGLVDLQRPVATYLPWFRVRTPGPPITLHHLLTHTAGLPRDRSDLPSSPYTALALRDRDPARPAGVRFTYSNIGYQLLSLVLEEVEGRPFAEAIRARVLDPLGLTHTAPSVTQEGRQASATGYQYLYDDRPPLPGAALVPAPWNENSGGDANIVTTAQDLATFLRMLLGQGVVDGRRVLQPRSFARMVQRTVPAPELGRDAFYGYGVVLGTLEGDPILWHSGGMPGFRAMLAGDLDEGLGVVVLMNGPGNPRRLGEYALRALIAARRGHAPPPVEESAPPAVIPEAASFAGDFRDSSGAVARLLAVGDSLWLEADGVRAPLYRDAPATFVTPHPAFQLFPLHVVRVQGRPTEFWSGGRWFTSAAYRGPLRFDAPAAWAGYVGHYRAQVPYDSNYRVVFRKGRLYLVSPEGLEEGLLPLGGGEFRVGDDPQGVERVRFADVVSGRALRMNLSGTEYYRATTP